MREDTQVYAVLAVCGDSESHESREVVDNVSA